MDVYSPYNSGAIRPGLCCHTSLTPGLFLQYEYKRADEEQGNRKHFLMEASVMALCEAAAQRKEISALKCYSLGNRKDIISSELRRWLMQGISFSVFVPIFTREKSIFLATLTSIQTYYQTSDCGVLNGG